MIGIHADKMKLYLEDAFLVETIKLMGKADKIRDELRDALTLLQSVNASAATQDEVTRKIENYKEIATGYHNSIEDIWHLTWQEVSIIQRNLDRDPDSLPEYSKL